jgi:hypothetical protein
MGCQLHLPRCPVEQPKTDTALQLSDQYTEPGWCDEQRFGGAREIPMLCHEAERTKLAGTDFHY